MRGSSMKLNKDESSASLTEVTGPLGRPNMKELVTFEAVVEKVQLGVVLKEYERVIRLNKATNPVTTIDILPPTDPYVEKRKVDGGKYNYKTSTQFFQN